MVRRKKEPSQLPEDFDEGMHVFLVRSIEAQRRFPSSKDAKTDEEREALQRLEELDVEFWKKLAGILGIK